MSKVEWIKIYVEMFDHPKVKYLRTLEEGDRIVLLWTMLLTKAGKCNSGGFIFLTESIPYTNDMLAAELGFDIKVVEDAIKYLKQLNMIALKDEKIYINGWEEHQNIEGLDKIREQNRKRVAKYREKKKCETNDDKSSNVTETLCNDIDKEVEEEKYIEIYNYWNLKNIITHRKLNDEMRNAIRKVLERYTVTEIKQAIDCYSEILKSDFYFNYIWSLTDFLNRKNGISTFMEEGSNKVSYERFKVINGGKENGNTISKLKQNISSKKKYNIPGGKKVELTREEKLKAEELI